MAERTYNVYHIGSLVTIRAVFTDPEAADVPYDPEFVNINVRSPGGPTVTYTYGIHDEVVKDSEGNYHFLLDADEDGEWAYKWWSTGTGQAAKENYFKVEASVAA